MLSWHTHMRKMIYMLPYVDPDMGVCAFGITHSWPKFDKIISNKDDPLDRR